MDVVQQFKNIGRTVGLITGCFDIIHLGHIKLFRYAKSMVDVVIVGVDSDMSISLSKGRNKPIFTQNIRIECLSRATDVDFVFPMNCQLPFGHRGLDLYYDDLLDKLKPTHIVTCVPADIYWVRKKILAKKRGIKLVKQIDVKIYSSSRFAKNIGLLNYLT